MRLGGETVELGTAPGVFSGSRIDPGTEVLLHELPEVPKEGRFLDIGCGYGPIALTMAAAAPQAEVWAVDVNDLALELCAENAERLGMDNVRTARPDDVPADLRFDFIASNPAIRIGKQNLHDMLSLWLGRLAPQGDAYLVVQRHLGSDSLQRWLIEEGWSADRYASRGGFRVLHCRHAD